MNLLGRVVTSFGCALAFSGCSHSGGHSTFISRPVPNSHVLLVPELQGGRAGWCLATGYRTKTEGSSGCGGITSSRAPIFPGEGCEEDKTAIRAYALTTSQVAAVSVYGGVPIPTTTNSSLPDGLRAAAVEILRHNGHPSIGSHCPQLVPLGANGTPVQVGGKRAAELKFSEKLPGAKQWTRGVPGAHPDWSARRPSRGACELIATRLPRETSARWGSVATVIQPVRGLVGRALQSCVDITYFYLEEHALDAAVLLDASHPGATPPPLPDMRPLAGHPGIFEAAGSAEMVARRVAGAWIVVEESDGVGPSPPIELLEHLHATIHT